MSKNAVYAHLNQLGIDYTVIEHPPVFTCEEAAAWDRQLRGAACKNLFLRNRAGDRHLLVSTFATKTVDLQALRRLPEINSNKLSFGSPERLAERLGLTSGSVSPFGLLNDPEKHVEYFLDEDLLTADFVSFHPNLNDATIEITPADFKTFIESLGRILVTIPVPVLAD